jgi:hypothetical protein
VGSGSDHLFFQLVNATRSASRAQCATGSSRAPQQLLPNCVADYVVVELQRCGNRPERVPIPDFTNVE